MTRSATVWRLLLLSVCLLGTAAFGARIMHPEQAPRPPLDLHGLPLTLDGWRGQEAAPFSPDVVAQLGVDEYVNRIYVADGQPVALYIGYYGSQRAGDTMHSPQNCLPGAGWLPVTTSRLTLPVDGRPDPISVNRLLIQKGLDRQVVLYWYQSHGRIVASDYWSKAYLVYDAIRLNRSDAAMVRVISPVLPSDADPGAAEARATAFIRSAFPKIDRLLPI
jgi:EpsI family protein